MAASIGTVYMDLRAASTNLRKDIDKAMKSTQRQLKAAAVMAGKVVTGATVAATAAVVAMTKNGLKAVDDLAKTSDKLNIATQNLQGMRHAAELTGASISELDKGTEKMIRSISEAAQGVGEAREAIAELGLSAIQLNRLSPDEQFKAIADAMNLVSNNSDRVRLAMDIFGRGGASLLNTLRLGREGIEAATQEIKDYGIAISRVDAAKVEAANDAMHRAGLIMQGISNRLAVELAPFIEGAAKKMLDLAKSTNGVNQAVGKTLEFFSGIGSAIDNVAYGIRIAVHAATVSFSAIGYTVLTVAEEIRKVFNGVSSVAKEVFTNIDIFARVGFAGATVWVIDFAQAAIGKIKSVETALSELAKKMVLVNPLLAKLVSSASSSVTDSIAKQLGSARDKAEKVIADNWADLVQANEKAAKAWKDATSDQAEGAVAEWRDTMGQLFSDAFDKVEQMLNEGLPGLRIVEWVKQFRADVATAGAEIESARAAIENHDPIVLPVSLSFESAVKGLGDLPDQALRAYRAEFEKLSAQFKAGAIDQDYFTEAMGRFKQKVQEAQSVFQSTRTNAELYQQEIRKLIDLLNQGVISQDTFNRAVSQTAERFDLTRKAIPGVAQETERYKAEMKRLTDQLNEGALSQEEFENAAEQAAKKHQKIVKEMESHANHIGNLWASVGRNIEDSIDQLVESGKFSFKDFANSVIKDLAKIQLRRMLIGDGLGAATGGGILNGLFRGLGFFAEGGRPPVNKASIVGEKGPELFIPDTAGRIVSNRESMKMLQAMAKARMDEVQAFVNGFPVFAEGGRPPLSKASIVGEKGPELFIPDRMRSAASGIRAQSIASATQSPRMLQARMPEMASKMEQSKSPTVIVQQTNNFEGGVTPQQVSEALKQHGNRIISTITDGIQRGGTFRQVFQS